MEERFGASELDSKKILNGLSDETKQYAEVCSLNGLTNCQENALARIWMAQDSLPADLTAWNLSDDLIVLRDCGMIDMQTDMSHTLAFVQKLLPGGREHYQKVRRERKSFVHLRDSADELIGRLVSDCDRDGGDIPPECYEDRLSDYQTLSRKGLIKVIWADDKPYHVQIMDMGREYVEGDFPLEAAVKIENNPTFNNVNYGPSATSSSNATAETSATVTLGMTIQSLIDMDIEDSLKEMAEAALKELDSAAKSKDKTGFAEKLERAASIAKSASTLAGVMLPFFQTAIQNLLS